MRIYAAAFAAFGILPSFLAAQSTTWNAEADVTGGYSSEDSTRAGSTQLRLFGETKSRIRFHVEGTWANRTATHSDQFGAAYPYNGTARLSEAYAERTFHRGSSFVIVRGGQYRSPFGISSRSDNGYSGFLRAPLMRYDGYWALSNNFLERGANIVAGKSWLTVEASLGAPGDIGVAKRRSGLNAVVRVQTYFKGLVLGLSEMHSKAYLSEQVAPGNLQFTGLDGRYAKGGVQVRGEWMTGKPWAGTNTRAWYVDTMIHRPFMGPVTAVYRVESLDFSSPVPYDYRGMLCVMPWYGDRQTMGGRVRLPRGFTANLNYIRQFGELSEDMSPRNAIDVGLTYSFRLKR
jgi:hypothetical protein